MGLVHWLVEIILFQNSEDRDARWRSGMHTELWNWTEQRPASSAVEICVGDAVSNMTAMAIPVLILQPHLLGVLSVISNPRCNS